MSLLHRPLAGRASASGALARVQEADGLVAHRSPLLIEHGIPHLFTTRIAARDRDDLDAGELCESDRDRLLHVAGMAAGANLVRARQIHGDGVAVVDDVEIVDAARCADALVSSRSDRVPIVFTADCVPVLVARIDGTRVAAIHAGWRGLVAGVIPRALEALAGGELVAAIGPCLSLARFEVGPEVVERFLAADLACAVHERAGAHAHVDLRHAARAQLERSGVHRLDVSDRCTWDDPELWSYRRDVTHGGAPRTGRLGALVAPRAAR